MPLHINLFHEQLAQKKQAERDPLKLGILAMIGVSMLLALFYFWKQTGLRSEEAKFNQAKAAFAKLEPEMKKLEAEQTSLEAKIALSKLITTRIEERLFWAPAIEVILKQIPPTAQLNSLSATSVTNPASIKLEGLAASKEPRALADTMRIGLLEELSKKYQNVTAEFGNLVDNETPVQANGEELPAVQFTITLRMISKNAVIETKPPPTTTKPGAKAKPAAKSKPAKDAEP